MRQLSGAFSKAFCIWATTFFWFPVREGQRTIEGIADTVYNGSFGQVGGRIGVDDYATIHRTTYLVYLKLPILNLQI